MSVSISRRKLCEVIGVPEGAGPRNGEAVFRGVEYDSRSISGGDLFIALPGETSHGEEFLDQAFARGAAMALVERAELLKTSAHAEYLIVVPDTLAAFWKLASWWRMETGVPLLGITGSVGKTTVKELCAAILLKYGVGTYAQKSFNNHVGVPYTLCKIHRDHQWAVVEMGMNHAGEISKLTQLAKPNVAVITTIAPAHIEHFSGIEGIAAAKLEIVDGLAPGAPLVLNHDCQVLVEGWKRKADPRPVVYFGSGDGLQCQVKNIETHALEGVSFTLTIGGEEAQVTMSMLGAQSAVNAACAALSCKTLVPTLTLEVMATALTSFRAPLMRLNQHELSDGRIVIDDSYNANPASMRSLLELGQSLSGKGKKVGLVLGDMLEQGDFSEQHHREIGALAAGVQPAFIVAIGKDARFYTASAQEQGIVHLFTDKHSEALSFIAGHSWEVLLVKASRGIGLDTLVKQIVGG